MKLHQQGFTLIEMLVVIGVMGVLMVGGVASYNQMNERAVVEEGARLVVTELRALQKQANTGQSACGSNPFVGIEISRVSASKLSAKYKCKNVAVNADYKDFPEKPLHPSVEIVDSPIFPFVFQTLNRGTSFPTNSRTLVVQNKQGTAEYTITLTLPGGVRLEKTK